MKNSYIWKRQKQIKTTSRILNRLISGDVCYHSVQYSLSSRLLSENVKKGYTYYNFTRCLVCRKNKD